MAFNVEDDEVWKCSKHPSTRRRSGICPVCLRERLATLCPDCATVRPCRCCAASSSSSSSSSSFSRFSVDVAGLGTTGRVSNLIYSEPPFRRSHSVTFVRSGSRFSDDKDFSSSCRSEFPASSREKTRSIWSMFRSRKSKRKEEAIEAEEILDLKTVMMRSKSAAVWRSNGGEVQPSSAGRGWYFPSPIKIFRQSRISKLFHERPPLCRG